VENSLRGVILQTGKRRQRRKQGIGLYTYEQAKNTTAFQYFAQMVIGAIVAAMGLLLLLCRIIVLQDEVRSHRPSGGHVWNWVCTIALIIVGVFMGHAGAIFYGRRVWRAASRLRRSLHTSKDGDS